MIPCALALIGSETLLRTVSLERVMRWSRRIHRSRVFRPIGKWCDVRFERIAVALERVDARLPFLKPSCLRRAVALKILCGEAASLTIGVRRTEAGALEAHAWAVVRGAAPDGAGFEVLTVF